MLKLAAQQGHINLKSLDESGCALESSVSYSYARIGKQKRVEQVKSYGERISILGLWQVEQSFEYVLVQGSFNKERHVKVMHQIAQKSEQILKETPLKTHEIAGRIFDNEYDLANAMIEGIENRS